MKYNAFISYKHAPEDNLVADAVHKGLEHFHIPGKLRRKTGIKKIDRIFRDKAELPITNDLSDNIADALENSDYLIVLCSTSTRESAWVPREIDCFLKNHTKRDVFTVLVNGEPHDVIPEILQYEERVMPGEDGREQTVRIPIEPLSCDYRIPHGKAKKTELPRLVSGLIGCAYDELMNRHRQYRIRLLTAVFSVILAIALGFCGYMMYSRDKIHQNYLESLKNQSKYLANESGILLEKERRITALQLALEALPGSDTDDRPITAEAVRALTEATLAYEGNNGTNIHAAWNYEMPNEVSDFRISNDGKTIAVLDKGSVVGVWNTETHEQILYFDEMDTPVVGIGFSDDSHLIMWTDRNFFCYDTGSGEKCWEYALSGDTFEATSSLMLADSSIFIGTVRKEYLELDKSSGKLINEISLPLGTERKDFGITESKLSPDRKKIAFRGLEGGDTYAYGVLDIGSKTMRLSDPVPEMVKDIEWAGNDNLMVASTKIDKTGSQSYGSFDIVSSDHSQVFCCNVYDLSVKWSTDFVCNGVKLNSGFVSLGENSVAYFSGNAASVYDRQTGREQYSSNVNDSIIDVSDRDGDGSPLYITESGRYATPALKVDADAVYYTRYFADKLRRVVVNNGVYVMQSLSNEVIYYGVHVYDESWTPLSEDTVLPNDTGKFCLDGNCLAVLSDDNGKPLLSIYGLGEDTSSQTVLEDGSVYKYQFLGVYNNQVYLGYENTQSFHLVTVDMNGNEVKKDELFQPAFSFTNSCTMCAGKLIYCAKNENYQSMLVIHDIDTDNKTEIALPKDIGSVIHAPVYYEEENAVYLQGDGAGYVFEIGSGETKIVSTPDVRSYAVCISDNSSDGKFAVFDGKQILMTDLSGEDTTTIGCPGVTPIGMTFLDDELIVLYNDGSLYRYAKDTGRFVKKTDVYRYSDFSGNAFFEYDEGNRLLYIQMDSLTDVVDMENGALIAHINNCYGHYQERDMFVTSARESSERTLVGYYRRYSVQELIKKAQDILQNSELSEAVKTRYGIE